MIASASIYRSATTRTITTEIAIKGNAISCGIGLSAVNASSPFGPMEDLSPSESTSIAFGGLPCK